MSYNYNYDLSDINIVVIIYETSNNNEEDVLINYVEQCVLENLKYRYYGYERLFSKEDDKKVNLIFKELIENGLHPNDIYNTLKQVFKSASENKCKYLFTTYSDYVIKTVSVLNESHKLNILYCVEKDGNWVQVKVTNGDFPDNSVTKENIKLYEKFVNEVLLG